MTAEATPRDVRLWSFSCSSYSS